MKALDFVAIVTYIVLVLGHDKSGIIESVDFDYGAVERALGEHDPMENSQEVQEAALRLFRKFMRWQWQDAPKKSEGLEIRAAINCHAFLPFLKAHTLEELANSIGKHHKQSIGRWRDDFNKRFPFIFR